MDKSRNGKSRLCNASSVWGLPVKSYHVVALINHSLITIYHNDSCRKDSFSRDQANIKKP